MDEEEEVVEDEDEEDAGEEEWTKDQGPGVKVALWCMDYSCACRPDDRVAHLVPCAPCTCPQSLHPANKCAQGMERHPQG